MKSLIRILIVLTVFLVIGISFNLFFSNNDDVLVGEPKEPVKDEKLIIEEGQADSVEIERPDKGISTYIGQPVAVFKSEFGEPSRIEESYYDYDWWIYNDDDSCLQVGVRNNKIAVISIIGSKISVYPFELGEDIVSVYNKVTMQPEVELTYDEGVYRFELNEDDVNIRPLIPLGDIFAQLYFDNFKGKLLFVRFLDKETLLKHRPYDMSYRGRLVESPPLTEEEWELADKAAEQQIFELTNIVRKEYSAPPVEWDEDTAQVAYHHSVDMFETENFSHVSETYGDLAERLKVRDVFYETAGENIAYQYTDSLAVVAGWLNSKGHRDTFLNEDFTHLGVGVYKKYYTQNFIRKSWEK